MIFEHPHSVTISFAKDADVPKTVEQAWTILPGAAEFFGQTPGDCRKPYYTCGRVIPGTYLPLLARLILEGNAKPGGTKLNLSGTILLDAWVDPWVQMASNTTYSFYHGLISAEQKEVLDKNVTLPNINFAIQTVSGVYMANIAEYADPSFDPVMDYLNDDAFRSAVHAPAVGPDTKVTQNWSAVVSNNYAPQVNDSYADVVKEILAIVDAEGNATQRVIVISGLSDAKDCNFIGTGNSSVSSTALPQPASKWPKPQNGCTPMITKRCSVLNRTAGS